MNGKECLLAFADVDNDYAAAANEIETIRRSFNHKKKRRTQMIGAVCGCIIVVFAVAAFGSGRWFHQTPAVIPSETGTADHPMTGAPSSETPSTVPGFVPSETQDPSVSNETQNQPTQSIEPSSVISPAVDATTGTPVSPDDSVIWGKPGTVSGSAYVTWNGKQVGYELWEILQKDTSGKTIAIVASPRINDQFAYNGKTIADYEADAYDEQRGLPDKLQQLLKEGEILKYGEALYTTGTPDGEIWARDLYESKIAYYGMELLSKYIENGDFLSDQVAADLALAQKATAAQDAYDEAVSAFYSQTAAAAASAFSAAGISCSVSGHGILLFASTDRFASLIAPGNAEWYYSLAQQDSGDTVRE